MRTWTLLLAALALTATATDAQDVLRVSLSSGFTPDPHEAFITAGGDYELEEENSECTYGYISQTEATLLEFEAGALDLYVYAETDIDAMMAIMLPSGEVLCDDDSHTELNPLIHIDNPESGEYIIFVGGFNPDQYSDATLYISELPPDLFGDGESVPSILLDPLFGDADLSQDFSPDPHTISMRAGGDLDVDVGDCSIGYVSDAPSFNFSYETSGSSELHVYARSDEDITLLINDPNGDWICDDDSLGDGDPLLTLSQAPDGLYQVWVGTYSEGTQANATLYVSRKAPK